MSIAHLSPLFRLDPRRAGFSVLLALALSLLSLTPRAAAQTSEFTLAPSALSPDAVAPGGVSSTSIQVQSQTGFTGTVDFTCQVTSTITTVDTPVCTVVPGSVTVPGLVIANLTTKATTTQTLYSVTITGTDPATSFTTTTTAQNFTVLAVTPQFTITVASAVAPTSVVAGSGAQGVISVNAANGYTTPAKGGITLACGSITPLVTIPPVCSFTYPSSNLPNVLTLNGGTAGIANLTISTFGPETTGSLVRHRTFYALWLSLPLLAFAGIGAATAGKRSRKAWALFAIFIVSASLLLIPACGTNTSATTSTPNGITPANTYTFTIIGVDSNGVVSSNISSTNTGPTVSLGVTAPPK